MYFTFSLLTCKLKFISDQWVESFSLMKSTAEFDLNLVNILYNRYLNQTKNGLSKWQNITMRLDTSEVKGHLFKTRVKMSWPSLLYETSENKSVFNFPLTQIGNTSYQNITIKNPSSNLLVVQLVMDKYYPHVDVLYEGLPPNLIPNYKAGYKRQRHGFAFQEDYQKSVENIWKKRKGRETGGRVDFSNSNIPIILDPGETFSFVISYTPTDAVHNSALLFLRNNLTVIEVIRLNGQGVLPNFKFGNRKPGSSLPLVFELTEKHLKDCEREKNRKYPAPNLSVKRSFTARNTGDVTVYVNKFLINGYECEGFGFKVLNCESFVLLPNGTRKIDIAFTPDFTVSKITRNLILETSLQIPVNYTLVTTIPPYYLSLCADVLLRPNWEIWLYYCAVSLMLFTFAFILIMPVIESDRILKQAIGAITKSNAAVVQPLDLKSIGAQTKSEVKSTKADVVEHKVTKMVSDVKFNEEEWKQTRQDSEKYTVLVPTTGKAKKKLLKKNSLDLNENHENTKKNWVEPQKKEKCKHNDAKQVNTENITNHIKKNVQSIKYMKVKPESKKVQEIKSVEVTHCEEETSSTTTESSNNEESEVKSQKTVPKKPVHPTLRPVNNKIEQKEAEVKVPIKLERRKSFPKVVPKITNNNKENREVQESKAKECKLSELKQKIDRNRKERKERQSSLKRQSEKCTNNKVNESTNASPIVCTSPSLLTNNVWSENKASFSDVVARSENTCTNTIARPFVQQSTIKPTLYVEPYKKQELGPIGTKRIEFWQSNSLNNHQVFGGLQDDYRDVSNSLFTDAHNMAIESSNSFLDFENAERWQTNGLQNSHNGFHGLQSSHNGFQGLQSNMQNNVSPLMNLMQRNNNFCSHAQNVVNSPATLEGEYYFVL